MAFGRSGRRWLHSAYRRTLARDGSPYHVALLVLAHSSHHRLAGELVRRDFFQNHRDLAAKSSPANRYWVTDAR